MSILHPTSEDRLFYRDIRRLVIPIVLQNLITNAVSSADVIMLNYVSEASLAAVSLASKIQFLVFGFLFGISTGTMMLCSQYWGIRDKKSIQAVMGIGLKITLGFTVGLLILVELSPTTAMRIFTNEPELIAIGCRYLRLITISYVLMGIAHVYECVMRSMERAKVSTIVSTTALSLNIFLNAVFIFGLFGAPKLGVIGVALATVIARSVELTLCVVDALRYRVLDFDFKIIFGRHPALMQDYIRYSVPALANDMVWTFAFASYSIILGHLGAEVVAASAIAATVRDLLTSVCYGFSGASTVVLGRDIGQNKMERAKRNAARLIRFAMASSVFMGIVILVSRPLVFRIFTLSPGTQDLLNFMLIISSYYVSGQVFNTLVIAGIFRAGGETRFGLICDTIFMWCVAVPISFLSAFVFNLPVKVVYFILCLDEFYKIPVVIKKYFSYTWLKNLTREYE